MAKNFTVDLSDEEFEMCLNLANKLGIYSHRDLLIYLIENESLNLDKINVLNKEYLLLKDDLYKILDLTSSIEFDNKRIVKLLNRNNINDN